MKHRAFAPPRKCQFNADANAPIVPGFFSVLAVSSNITLKRDASFYGGFEGQSMKNVIAIIATSMLCSCGFMTPAKQYQGDSLGAADIAVIQSVVGTPFADDYHATIIGYTKIEPNGSGEQKEFGLPGFTDYPSEIHVLPGEYEIQVYCFKGFSSHRPRKTLTLQAGQTYLLKCDALNDQAFIGVNSQPK